MKRILPVAAALLFASGTAFAFHCPKDMNEIDAALEAQARGVPVEVVSLAPGVIDTGMQATVRGASAEDFADVERFRRMKEEGALRSPDEVAADILRLEAAGRLAGEPVADLRQLGG